MTFETVLKRLAQSLSGARASAHVADIARYHRIQASPGFDEALEYVRDALSRIGIRVSTSSFTADGQTKTYGWVAPIAWRIRAGSLREIAPTQRTLCSFSEAPISILGQSGAGRSQGELVHLGKGTADDVAERELEGRFVLSCGRPTEVLRQIRGKGAAGLVLYPDSARASASYDLVQYAGLFPKADDLKGIPMGFSVSRREADRLLKELEKGPVRLEGEVDADHFAGSMRVLEAEIEGGNPQSGEVLLVAHLCHPRPSANDNASGSGLLIEIARAIGEIGRDVPLRNTVRLLWVPEFNGTIPWAAANVEKLRRVRYVLNLDMIGQSPEVLGEPLRVFRVPNARPSFLNACFEPILSRIAEDEAALSSRGSRRPLHWILDAPSGGSDHLVFQAAPHELPAAMLGHNDPYWHTDLDATDKVDATRLKHVGLTAAALAMLPTWGADEAPLLGQWLLAFSARELARVGALAAQVEAGRRRRLLATARAIEDARAGTLHELVGEGVWDRKLHGATLQSIEKALAGPLPLDVPAKEGRRPRRVLDGPVRFEIVELLSQDERTFLEEKLSTAHRAVIESLVSLCDGKRDLDEIALRLTLDFGRPFSVDDTRRGVELLVKAGYLVA